MARYHKKFLDDGITPNPKHVPKKCGRSGPSGKHPRKYLDDGETLNPKYKPRKCGKHKSEFQRGNFIAVDGEGEDLGGKHIYTYLACTDASIYNPIGLTSIQCFDFLIDMGARHPHGIFCIFAGGYDANMWLRDVPKETILQIVEADGQYPIYWEGYGIRFIQRRFFTIQKSGAAKKTRPVKIWDVWGFFQGTFINAVKSWLPDYDKLELIIQGKLARIAFTGSDKEFMQAYNAAELEALVMLMEKLREALITMGLTLTGWHGAGAVATAIYKHHDVKSHYEKPPEHVYEATKHSYFGGRIEIFKYGSYTGTVHHYDINSAYPAEQRYLPSLVGGTWKKRGAGFDSRTTKNICISLARWQISDQYPICPFPVRSAEMRKILFPAEGYNWLWKPETDAALKWADIERGKGHDWTIDIEEAYEFIPATDIKPFAFIGEYYSTRQEIVAESKRTGIPNGVEKAIKLGINSLYGKAAQRVGYDKKTGRIPPYHNLVYAGYITSGARAKLYDAAMQSPDNIICVATDGIYSTAPLELDCPKEKILGAWEYQTHDEMVIVQSGFYFLRNGDKWESYSRGFDRMSTPDDIAATMATIKKAWAKKENRVFLPCTRFITLKSALCGGDWWQRWLSWYKYKTLDKKTGIEYDGRKLQIDCENTKRRVNYGTMKRSMAADKCMIDTLPTTNIFPDVLSAQHMIPWDDNDETVSGDEVDAEHDIDSMV